MKYCLLVLAFLAFCQTYAQDARPIEKNDSSRTFYEFTLRGGRTIAGKILEKTDTTYRIQTRQSGKLTLAKDQVISVRPLGEAGEEDEITSFANKFTDKMLFMPTAVPVERNTWRYTNTWVYFSSFSYGITDHWSVGVNIAGFLPLGVYTKVTFNPKSPVKLALHAQYFGLPFYSSGGNNGTNLGGIGYVQGVVTTGTAQNNATFAIGGLVSGRGIGGAGLLTLGFVKKVGPKLSFISQNHLVIGNFTDQFQLGVLIPALRLDRRAHAFDLGLALPFVNISRYATGGSGEFFMGAFPYVGLNVKIN